MASKKETPKVVQHPAQATHVVMPVEVFNALSALVGQEIPWGIADQVMTLVKQNVQMHTPEVKQDAEAEIDSDTGT